MCLAIHIKCMKKILTISLILILLAVAGAFALVKYINFQYKKPVALLEEQIITINKGDAISKISDNLFASDFNKIIFSKLAIVKGRDGDIKTGEFLIPKAASIKNILDIITSNNTINYKITIVEGYQKYQIRNIFTGIDNLSGEIPEIKKEGLFLPDTYLYKSGDTKESILNRAKDSMNKYLDEVWLKRDKTTPLKSKYEALVLASIIEKETSQEGEYKVVASVFINRLNKRMKLQADSTSIYGITNGEKKFNRKLYKGDLAKKNEFNTYYIKGLPKKPICNPSRKAIDAAVNPAKTKYLYFVADGTGGHVFSKTSKEHERNVVRWRKIKKKRFNK